ISALGARALAGAAGRAFRGGGPVPRRRAGLHAGVGPDRLPAERARRDAARQPVRQPGRLQLHHGVEPDGPAGGGGTCRQRRRRSADRRAARGATLAGRRGDRRRAADRARARRLEGAGAVRAAAYTGRMRAAFAALVAALLTACVSPDARREAALHAYVETVR